MSIELASLIISAISVLVAILAWRKSSSVQLRLLEIEEAREQDREIAGNQALLRARLSKRRKPKKLFIKNQGKAQARNVEVLVDHQSVVSHPAVKSNQTERRTIGPTAVVVYHLKRNEDRPKRIHITWVDDSGEPGLFESDL